MRSIDGKTISSISYNEFQNDPISYVEDISYIVVAVAPIAEQEKVIQWLLDRDLQILTLIEKPVSNNLKLLETCLKNENLFFYIDEYILMGVYKKLLLTVETPRVDIEVHDPYGDDASAVYEHALAPFFSFEDFPAVFQHIQLLPGASLVSEKDILMYRVTF